jgi:cargo-transport protein YPP1
MHYPNHASAIVGLSNILLDLYCEVLVPPPPIPGIAWEGRDSAVLNSVTTHKANKLPHGAIPELSRTPLGLGPDKLDGGASSNKHAMSTSSKETAEDLPPTHKATSLPLVDRLASRDRAYGLLSTLTKLGIGWNNSDAWFALARAHEESGQPDKAKEALWWCVELEEGTGVRDWSCVGVGGYVL